MTRLALATLIAAAIAALAWLRLASDPEDTDDPPDDCVFAETGNDDWTTLQRCDDR
jgi:hypothetical protein